MSDSLSPDEFRLYGHTVVEWAARYLQDIGTYPVLPAVAPGELRQQLPTSGPAQGETMEQILADFERLILPATTHWNHPRFHAYFSVSASGAGILAELLTATLNVNGMLWKSSPAATELEQVTLDWLRQWLGLPDPLFGIIYDTASISTLHALAAAREQADPEARVRGAQPGLVVYTSEQSHSSVEKGAISLGMGQRHVRKIAVDGQFRMRPDALEAAIQADQADGLRPCCVVATVGTTSTTSVDPVPAIAEIAKSHGLWLHVDAAYGGAMAVVPEYRDVFAGVALADSLVVNPHKWLFTPIDCSVLYTRRPDVLRRTFSLVPEFLRTEYEDAINLMDYGTQLGRRFRALKLWFVMRHFGHEGMAALIRQHCEWAQALADLIAKEERFELMAPVPMSTVCFRLRSGDEATRRVMEQVNESGVAFLSHTVLHGQYTIRLALGNVRTTWQDVQTTWQAIQKAAVE